MNITFYDYSYPLIQEKLEVLVNFLHWHLGAYGDPHEDIRKAIECALGKTGSNGGFVCIASDKNGIIGAAVINRTNMEGYIPENILVYLATHNMHRRKGVGRQLLTEVIGRARGNIALHVEPENPARSLYESVGFVHKYLEMRLLKKEGK